MSGDDIAPEARADGRAVDAMPRIAAVLGFGGLLPPLLAILLVTFGGHAVDPAPPLLGAIAYAAIILSFLGGMWWGVAAARLERRALTPWLVLSVMPSLIAWPALFIAITRPLLGSALIGIALVTTLLGDRRLAAERLVPGWWLRLRVPLSCGLALSTMAAGWLAQQ